MKKAIFFLSSSTTIAALSAGIALSVVLVSGTLLYKVFTPSADIGTQDTYTSYVSKASVLPLASSEGLSFKGLDKRELPSTAFSWKKCTKTTKIENIKTRMLCREVRLNETVCASAVVKASVCNVVSACSEMPAAPAAVAVACSSPKPMKTIEITNDNGVTRIIYIRSESPELSPVKPAKCTSRCGSISPGCGG